MERIPSTHVVLAPSIVGSGELYRYACGMSPAIVLRRGTPDDSRAAFEMGIAAVRDLMSRQNHPLTVDAVAMRHLLGRGFRIDAPFNLFMSNRSLGQFDRFIAFAPSIVL